MKKLFIFILFFVVPFLTFAQSSNKPVETIKIPHVVSFTPQAQKKSHVYDITEISKELGFVLQNQNGCPEPKRAHHNSILTNMWEFTDLVSIKTIVDNQDFKKGAMDLEDALAIAGSLYKNKEICKEPKYIIIPVIETICFADGYVILYCINSKITTYIKPQAPTEFRPGDIVVLKVLEK